MSAARSRSPPSTISIAVTSDAPLIVRCAVPASLTPAALTEWSPAQYSPGRTPTRAVIPRCASVSTSSVGQPREALADALGDRLHRPDDLDQHRPLVIARRVPAAEAQQRRVAVPARGLARGVVAGRQRVEAAEGHRRPGPEDPRDRPAVARADLAQQGVRDRGVEHRIVREAIAQQLHEVA